MLVGAALGSCSQRCSGLQVGGGVGVGEKIWKMRTRIAAY